MRVSIATFFSTIWVSAHSGEKGCGVIAHWRMAFVILGVPSTVKTDNGLACVFQKTKQFLQMWRVSHKLGTPHSPFSNGQTIAFRVLGLLKRVLDRQRRGMPGETPHSGLEKALCAINHL
ncbi:hypothetical protein Nmel_005749, partial [Mimus melanotis]